MNFGGRRRSFLHLFGLGSKHTICMSKEVRLSSVGAQVAVVLERARLYDLARPNAPAWNTNLRWPVPGKPVSCPANCRTFPTLALRPVGVRRARSRVISMTSFRDALVIYTDGLTEAQNLQDEYYGDARFAAAISAAPAEAPALLAHFLAQPSAFTVSESWQTTSHCSS